MKTRLIAIPVVIGILILLPACGHKPAASTALPATQPPATATASPTALPTDTPLPPNPCDNVLFPLLPGSQWIYQVTSSDGSQPAKLGLTVDKVVQSQAAINALNMSSGVLAQATAECDNGAILDFPSLTQLMLLGNAAASKVTVKYVSGVFAPAEADFKAHDWFYQWTTDLTATGTLNVQDGATQAQIVMNDSPIHLACKTAGSGEAAFEPLTVQAGTFQKALKVLCQVQSDVSLIANGTHLKGKIILQTTQWFDPSAGLLKSQVDSGNVVYLGMNFPVQLKNTLELLEFHPGQ